MNTMTRDGFSAKIEYDAELDVFRGEILGLSGGADVRPTPKPFIERTRSAPPSRAARVNRWASQTRSGDNPESSLP